MIRALILVGIGGGAGSVLRYLTTLLVSKYYHSIFPLATLAANVLGCLLIGSLIGVFEKQQISNPDFKYLFITGFCGGYTTFSAFAFENFRLFQSDNYTTAFLYIGLSVLAGLLAIWIGLTLTKLW